MNKSVGVVGVGIMGTAMARNLCQAGFDVVGYDPIPQAIARLEEIGGRALASPRAVAEAAPAEPVVEGEDESQAAKQARKKSARPAHKAPSRKPATRAPRRPAKPKTPPENS